jgi:MFS family permease
MTSDTDAPVVQRNALTLAFGGLLVAMFIAALDQTIMSTALPTIAGQLGGLGDLPWIVTVYVLGAAATTPLWGKASDLYGRIGELIAFRALQGWSDRCWAACSSITSRGAGRFTSTCRSVCLPSRC